MNPDVFAFLQRSMHLTDDELAAIEADPEQLQALLDVVFDDSSDASPTLHQQFTAPTPAKATV